jgi:hypothetical protein
LVGLKYPDRDVQPNADAGPRDDRIGAAR